MTDCRARVDSSNKCFAPLPLGGGVVVLYHCCVSLGMARALALVGFMDDELIPVTEHPPLVDKNNPEEAFGVVMLNAPFDFRLEDYPLQVNDKGELEHLVPGAVLSAFQRAIWPV